MRRLFLLLGFMFLSAAAADRPAAEDEMTIGYLELAGDPRYAERKGYARIVLETPKRPFAGAELGLADAAMIADALGIKLKLERIVAPDREGLAVAITALRDAKNVRFFIADLPAEALKNIAAGLDTGALFFNISEGQNSLRGKSCLSNIIHIYPSLRMRTDAIVQYLRAKGWTDVLMLVGPEVADARFSDSFEESVARYGADIVDVRPFVLSNDPRLQEKGNVALLTASAVDYDVVVLADDDGEFGRYVPYATNRPRPVLGGSGLTAQAWHWALERYGAPQLNSRFMAATDGRHMSSADWAAWVAVKTLIQARLRAPSAEFGDMVAYIRGDRIRIDGFKGVALSVRPWNNQLRQPIPLATHNAVIAMAPIKGFLHPVDDLDTLGADANESECDFR